MIFKYFLKGTDFKHVLETKTAHLQYNLLKPPTSEIVKKEKKKKSFITKSLGFGQQLSLNRLLSFTINFTLLSVKSC